MKVIKVKKVEIGRGFTIIAGPCSVESREQMRKTLLPIYSNIDIIRGGAFKPRTSPESFQGLGEEGLIILKEISEELDIPFVTEVMDTRDVELVAFYADILQIGARNMQNYSLLKEVSKVKKPVLLKRGLASTVKEWLCSLEYIAKGGNTNIILCERGIRTFENLTRFTLDLAGAVIAQKESNLPVIIDPSHATGRTDLIEPLVKASEAAGMKGVMIEVHYKPEKSKSDKEQALTPAEFKKIFYLTKKK